MIDEKVWNTIVSILSVVSGPTDASDVAGDAWTLGSTWAE